MVTEQRRQKDQAVRLVFIVSFSFIFRSGPSPAR
jgi:hypothetical protein